MRKSRRYLVLSIVSLLVGVGASFMSDHHDCRHSDKCKSDRADADVAVLRSDAMQMIRTRDYDQGCVIATELVELDSNESFHHELLAYALRGKGAPRSSILEYERAIKLARSESYADSLVLADCYIGLAANQHALNENDDALRNVNTAIRIAEKRRRISGDDDAYYQLACAYAVRSTITKAPQSQLDRGSALANLRFAIDEGFDSWEHMAGDLDLAALHDDADFEDLFPHSQVPAPATQYER